MANIFTSREWRRKKKQNALVEALSNGADSVNIKFATWMTHKKEKAMREFRMLVLLNYIVLVLVVKTQKLIPITKNENCFAPLKIPSFFVLLLDEFDIFIGMKMLLSPNCTIM